MTADSEQVGPFSVRYSGSYDSQAGQVTYECQVLDEEGNTAEQWSSQLANGSAASHLLPVDTLSDRGPLGGQVYIHFLDGILRVSGFLMDRNQDSHQFDLSQTLSDYEFPKWPDAFMATLNHTTQPTPPSLEQIIEAVPLPKQSSEQWVLGTNLEDGMKVATRYQVRVLDDRVVFEYRFFAGEVFSEFSQAEVSHQGQLLKASNYSTNKMEGWAAYSRHREWPDGTTVLTEYFKPQGSDESQQPSMRRLSPDGHWAYPAALDPLVMAYHLSKGHKDFTTAAYTGLSMVVLSRHQLMTEPTTPRPTHIPDDAVALRATTLFWPIGDTNASGDAPTNEVTHFVDASGFKLLGSVSDGHTAGPASINQVADELGISVEQLQKPMPDPPRE